MEVGDRRKGGGAGVRGMAAAMPSALIGSSALWGNPLREKGFRHLRTSTHSPCIGTLSSRGLLLSIDKIPCSH